MLGSIVTILPFAAHSQERTNLRVGNVALAPLKAPTREAFLKRMKELVTRKVDIILACGQEICLKSALAATSKLPIVMIAVDHNPFTKGYVKSLARPGGNVTGLFFQQITLTKKRLQLMKEAFPNVKAATVFWDWVSSDQWKGAKTAADELGFPVHGVELRARPYNYDRAISQVAPEARQALMVLASPIFRFPKRTVLLEFALRNRIPTMFFVRWWVDAGDLISYGASFDKLFSRVADYVDLIAKGAKSADLPIEQPTNFELVLNLRTAKALGIKFPSSILLRADDVAE